LGSVFSRLIFFVFSLCRYLKVDPEPVALTLTLLPVPEIYVVARSREPHPRELAFIAQLMHLNHEAASESFPVGVSRDGKRLKFGQSELSPALDAQKLPNVLVFLECCQSLTSAHQTEEVWNVKIREDRQQKY